MATATHRQAVDKKPRGGAPETRRCCYCKKERNLKLDCLKLKAKRAAEEAKDSTSSSAVKTYNTKDGADKHAHKILVDGLDDFNTRAKEHFFFSQMVEKSVIYQPYG